MCVCVVLIAVYINTECYDKVKFQQLPYVIVIDMGKTTQ